MCKIIFQQILHSGQWKLIFWLVETILCQYLKYLFHWKQFFHLLKIYFKRILYHRQCQQIFFLVETTFFHSHFFGNHYCNQREAIILKKSCFCQKKPCSLFVFDTDSNGSSLAGGNGFSINQKLCAFIRSFFLLVDTILQISCQPISFHFFYS